MIYLRSIIIVAVLFFMPYFAVADVIGVANQEVETIATPVLEGILEGFKTDDYAKYSKDFDDMLKEAIPQEKFLQTDKQFEGSIGECVSKEYLGFLNQGKMTVILWKGKFSKSENDILIKLVMSKRGERYLATGLWFQ